MTIENLQHELKVEDMNNELLSQSEQKSKREIKEVFSLKEEKEIGSGCAWTQSAIFQRESQN